jgi:DNA adenine methylase
MRTPEPGKTSTNGTAEPLLKWPGGKRRLLQHILPLVPQGSGRYFEPLLGGGALFFRFQPHRAKLSDKNEELINCYIQVRDHLDEVIDRLSRMKNTEANYYGVRDSKPTSCIGRAARFIFLTTLAFNGIYRVNLRGQFNVPYGRKIHLDPCDREKVRRSSVALAGAKLVVADFEEA